MVLSCGGKTLKYTLFVFNAVFWLTGVVLIGLGIWVLVDSHATQYLHVGDLDYQSILDAAITIIIVGVLIFIVSGLGCCGACTESKACLTGFAAFLVFIILLQVVAIILAAVLHSKVEDELGYQMNITMHQYGDNSHNTSTEGWNFLQIKMQCCGVRDPADWNTTSWYKDHEGEVPDSCCVQNNYTDPTPLNASLCYAAAFNESLRNRADYVYLQGCLTGLEDWFISKVGIFIGIVVGIIIIQVAVVALSCFLKRKITAYEYV